jgi:glycosyltransferase involved in cell wall biosynthesis
MTTLISVIIATRNRQGLLEQTLAALTAQTWPPGQTEIIVADNGSIDDTRAVVERAIAAAGGRSLIYLNVATAGKSHAVNAALGVARGDLLAFTDDDVVPQPDWLERLAAAFDETGAEFAAGRILPRWEIPPPSWMSTALYGVLAIPDGGDARRSIRAGLPLDVMPIGANMAVRADIVRRLGGLRVDFGKLGGTLRSGEDHEFFLRMVHAGCHGIYEPSAMVRHWVPQARVRRTYIRHWLYQNGRDVARLETFYPTPVRLLGVPRYRWRMAARDAMLACRGGLLFNARQRFAGAARLIWLGGYVRERWFGPGVDSTALALQPLEHR